MLYKVGSQTQQSTRTETPCTSGCTEVWVLYKVGSQTQQSTRTETPCTSGCTEVWVLHKVGSRSNSTEYQDRNTMYLGVYGGLGVAQGR